MNLKGGREMRPPENQVVGGVEMTPQEMADGMERLVKKYEEESIENQIKGLVEAKRNSEKKVDDELNKLDPDKSIRAKLNLL